VFLSSAIAAVTCDIPFRSEGMTSVSDDQAFISGEVNFYIDPILGLDVERFPSRLGGVNHQSWDDENLVVEIVAGSGNNYQFVFLDDFSDLKVFEYTSLGTSQFETCRLSSASNENGIVFCQAQRALLFSTACHVTHEN
jgi:hypothetical protein